MTATATAPPSIHDTVRWWNAEVGCSRCGDQAKYYVRPYWDRRLQVCPRCCLELNVIFEGVGWPPHPDR